ncbi:hypothetical protein [Modestobacter italicus]|uniref:hypothetical protein n=1 Tax=Modestobacter italicus (strain DSM 44449 / CECT 9708 / BC 501) TaxID=2732864 RepID=UPI001C945C91|nr:hypothetical protein [Modestobacter italicus]
MVYRPVRGARWLLLAVLAVFSVAAVGLVVATVGGNGPPVLFVAAWLAAFGWNAYWWGVRTAVEVRVDGPTLTWRTVVRSAEVPLHDVLRVRPSRASRQLAVIELREARRVLVPVRYGFGALERAILAGAPGASVEES